MMTVAGNTSSTQTVASSPDFLRNGQQEIFIMSLEHFIVPGSKEVTQG